MAKLTKREKEVAKISVVGEAVSIVISIVGAILLATGVGTIAGIFLLMFGLGGVCGFFPTLPLSHCTPNDNENIVPITEENGKSLSRNYNNSSKTILLSMACSQTDKKSSSKTSHTLSASQASTSQLSLATTISNSICNFFNAIFSADVPDANSKVTTLSKSKQK